jgi:ssRNA-specific RNase YbeY (16S rRNA maturation enzyme)
MSPDGSTFLFRTAPRGLDRKRLRLFQDTLTTLLTKGRTFTCLLTSDAELRRLNATFLGHDYPTDVLSFPSVEGEESLGSWPSPPLAPRRKRPILTTRWKPKLKS